MPQIHTLLIANRGEIAIRIARTAQAMGISPIMIYSDADAGALHVSAGDGSVSIGGLTAADSYLRKELIIDAAKRSGADAVHPGYGFLSENEAFAEAVVNAGLIWVGPRPETIAVMGDKVQAKRMMAAAGVPVLSDVVVDANTDLMAAARSIGLPIIAKAAAGGGGKGMRLITDLSELETRVQACRREALAAFGDDRVFLERFLPGPRHIEVQIAGDQHGNVIHLFERECSIQRRHQKVLEEAPSSGIDDELRARLHAAAVAAGRTLRYEGVGTVEFVVGSDRSAAFLEVNTRIQVEHPITEAITGIDLVRLQLQVAQGQPLPFSQSDVRCSGHAIEARLYAEDPGNDYLPAAGYLHAFEPAPNDGVRWDSGVASGSTVSAYYDPMLAKVIVHSQERAEGARILARALRRAHIQGPVNNRELLCAILTHPAFLAAETTTAFLERHFPTNAARRFAPDPQLLLDAVITATVFAATAHSRGNPLPSGWRNNPSMDQFVSYEAGGRIDVGYRRDRSGAWRFRLQHREASVVAYRVDEQSVDLAVDGRRFPARVSHYSSRGGTVWEVTTARGSVSFEEKPRFEPPARGEMSGATVAPMHGTVTVILVSPGAAVNKGDPLCIVEAMKMEHQVSAPYGGVVTSVLVTKAQQVEAGQPLVIVEADAQEPPR